MKTWATRSAIGLLLITSGCGEEGAERAEHATSDRAKILVVHSYHPEARGAAQKHAGLTSVLDDADVEYKTVYLDTRRLADEKAIKATALSARRVLDDYGPAVLIVPMGGGAPEKWRAKWSIGSPATGAVLRGLIGLSADAPSGSTARVSLRLKGQQREWPLMTNLEIRARPGDADGAATSRRNWPAVVEAGLPAEASGQQCEVLMETATEATEEFSLAVPCLHVCQR